MLVIVLWICAVYLSLVLIRWFIVLNELPTMIRMMDDNYPRSMHENPNAVYCVFAAAMLVMSFMLVVPLMIENPRRFFTRMTTKECEEMMGHINKVVVARSDERGERRDR